MKLSIGDAAIEVTRRCNMSCEHCLRGDAEHMDISDEYLDAYFSKIERVNNLAITGGEPSIAVGRIRAIIKAIKRHRVEVGSFYMVTNAKLVTKAFLSVIFDLYMLCDDNEWSCLCYSNDDFHDDVLKDNIEMLSVFKFTQPKGTIDPRFVLYEGRGKYFGTARYVEPDKYDLYENEVHGGSVYLNCEGNIIAGCDFSYESQRDEDNIVCSVEDMSFVAFETYVKLSDASDEDEEAA